jgi:hypothetical protein
VNLCHSSCSVLLGLFTSAFPSAPRSCFWSGPSLGWFSFCAQDSSSAIDFLPGLLIFLRSLVLAAVPPREDPFRRQKRRRSGLFDTLQVFRFFPVVVCAIPLFSDLFLLA